ncbi:peptidoglycan-recognition protein LC-like isoform X1 [Bradysia coprophila]|uniref:peptidoglycan-recognition protein LC-like isoform X1 n=1 Tax=Bradysia coprophila TaxID=38358 RepID=UPI00187DA7D5|nr:peptidoglycan-recognition protein LC-like isoform X1 [Bradysia coprophila]XP_037045310.1 peptidoglycan-recognition protein LC-like isoform X1 [Bradysia coprophila]
MSIDQVQNITTDNVNSSTQPKLNSLSKPDQLPNITTDSVISYKLPTLNDLNGPSDSKFDCHSLSPSINNVTIESLSDGDSSVIDSDSDIDEIPKTASEFFRNRVVCTTNGSHDQNQGVIVINETNSSDKNNVAKQPQIGSIAVQNSSDITFGNKTFYQGPVTIKQFLLEKNQWRPTESGEENRGFEASNRDISADNDKPTNTNQNSSKKKKLREKILHGNRPILIAIGITGIAVVIGALVFSKLYISTVDDGDVNPGDGDDWRKNIPINSSIENDIKTSEYGSSLRYVTRSEWLAQPPNSNLNNLELPSQRVIIAHTATENCTNQATCTFRVRYIQTFHMESQGWDDIGYNFLVGGDGAVYEGRGWDKEGAHTKGFNKRSICIAFIGTFNKMVPPKRQLTAAEFLIDRGVKLNKLIPDYQLYGHRQLIPSESPGPALYEVIKTWPHWSEKYIP